MKISAFLRFYFYFTLIHCFIQHTNCYEIKSSEDAGDYLTQFGYIPHWRSVVEESNSVSISKKDRQNFQHGISTFQQLTGLKRTGIFDKETQSMMNRPRCGMRERMDMTENKFMNMSTVSHAIPSRSRGKWNTSTVRYKIFNYPDFRLLDIATVRKEIRRAFRLWEEAANLRCLEIPLDDDKEAEINISFANGEHGDGNPFGDVSIGNVVAHAFYPNHKVFKGNIHFDRERLWTAYNATGINLYQVAAHEIGHALGLDHSRFPTSVMHMIIHSDITDDFSLHVDDIQGIRNLYGPNLKRLRKPKSRPLPEPLTPRVINPDFTFPVDAPKRKQEPDFVFPSGDTDVDIPEWGKSVILTTKSRPAYKSAVKEGTILYGVGDLNGKNIPLLENTLHRFWECFALSQSEKNGDRATTCYAQNVADLLYSLKL